MIFITYVDIYETLLDEETGELYQELKLSNSTLPLYLDINEVLTVNPMLTNKGTLFKNVSKITDRYGNAYKVVGNYKDIIKKKENGPKKQIGYTNGKSTN